MVIPETVPPVPSLSLDRYRVIPAPRVSVHFKLGKQAIQRGCSLWASPPPPLPKMYGTCTVTYHRDLLSCHFPSAAESLVCRKKPVLLKAAADGLEEAKVALAEAPRCTPAGS